MESNNELKEIDIKNCTCYYFDDIMNIGAFNFNNILLDKKSYEKSYENILIYDIWYKTFIGTKQMCIRLDKVGGFVKVYDGSRYLVLFCPERYDAVYDRIIYITSQKSGITYSINHNFAIIRIELCNSWLKEKTLFIML